ncbi:hypothetical protein [Endozoicomonas sp. 4G]|uniref:hypothetical protein n=1 Tax=Endozoicomonas sp. 4G TaxID=2872754 RepID=UPI0020790289|nr:hypothetical protein [Endozoicomonas sp. 4G]
MPIGGGNIPPSQPPGSHSPVVTTPETPSSSDTGGIAPRTKPNALPGGHNEAPDTPISRRSTVPATPASHLSPLKRLESDYHQQFNQVLSFQAQHDFLNFIPDLTKRLKDPSQFQDDLPFEIVFVKKNGKMTSVLPPDPDLPTDSQEATQLRESLQKKLTVIDQKNGPEEKRALREQIENTKEELVLIGREIEENGGTFPAPPVPKITLVIDENQFTARSPARPFNPARTPHQQTDQGQFLLIPKDASKRMPPPVATKPVRPLDVPDEGVPDEGTSIRSTGATLTHHAPAFNHVRHVERLLPLNEGGQFSDIYLTEETEADYGQTGGIASVNAGSVDLLFGEDATGMNARFGEFFPLPQQKAIEKAQQDFLAGARNERYSGYVLSNKDTTENTPLATILGHVTNRPDHLGTVFVSVFRDEHCPAAIKKNRAMIYVVPPDRSHKDFEDKDVFLDGVRQTAKNLIATQNEYNHWAAKQGQPTLPVLRACDFVSDIYRHADTTKAEVAKAIREGIKDYFEADNRFGNTIMEVQYEHGL